MKKLHYPIFPFLFGLFLLFNIPSSMYAQNFENAGEYMTHISEQYSAFNKELWNYIKASSHGRNIKVIENRRKTLLGTTRIVGERIKKMPLYQEDGSLRDSVASYLKLIYHVLNDDYAEIVDLEEIAEQSYDLMEAYILTKEAANQKMDNASQMLSEQQELFAANHRVNLVRGKTGDTDKNLAKAGEVYQYYNSIFLVFFKSNIQENYVMDALKSNDVNALVQNKNALLKYSEEGLAKLDTFQLYQADKSLLQSTHKVLKFYQFEAKEKLPVLADFFLKKENFHKIKQIVDAKKPEERTAEDISTYNQAVEDFNNAVSEFNITNDLLNDKREKLITEWNHISETFIDKHVP